MSYLSINQLMSHLRKSNISIGGSRHKKLLMQIGYFHGYKGYRYCKSPSVRLNYNDFDELLAVTNFDMAIKTLFYTPLMQLETTLKSVLCQIVVEKARSSDFNDIFHRLMLPSCASSELNQKCLKMKDSIHREITNHYFIGNIVLHYVSKGQALPPLWGIFEIIPLGTFGEFLKYLRSDIKEEFARLMGFKSGDCTGGRIAYDTIFVLKGLRNAVAHNSPVFDTRFTPDSAPIKCTSAGLKNITNINEIRFSTVVDYLILISFLLRSFEYSKTDIRKLITDFKKATESFRQAIPAPIFHKIMHTDSTTKLLMLDNYIKSN